MGWAFRFHFHFALAVAYLWEKMGFLSVPLLLAHLGLHPNTKLDSHPSGIISRNKLFLHKSLWVMLYNSKVTSTGQSPWLEEVEAWPSSCHLALLGMGFIQCV